MARYRIKKKAGSIYGGLILRDAAGANPVEYRVEDVVDLTPAQLTQFSAMLDFVSETAPPTVDALQSVNVPQSDLQVGDVPYWDGTKWVGFPPDKPLPAAITNVQYDANGNVTSITEGGVTTTYTYDTTGTVLTESSRGVTRTFQYDTNGNITGATIS